MPYHSPPRGAFPTLKAECSTRMPRLLACVGIFVATSLLAQEGHAQVRIDVGAMRQGSPTTTERGAIVAIGVARSILPSLSIVPELEFSRSEVIASVSVCYFVDDANRCLHRASAERALALGTSLDWHPIAGAIRPHVAAGVSRVWTSSGPNAGEASSFYAPQVAAGIALGRTPAITIDLRMRQLDRWGPKSTSGQGALLFGLGY